MSLEVGQQCKTIIEDVTLEGDGIGRYQGMAVFIPGALAGEEVTVRIIEKKKNFARGQVIDWQSQSPHRVNAPCPVFEECGGCQLQMASYEHQLSIKENAVTNILKRIGKLENPPIKPILASPEAFRYRNRVQFHLLYNRQWRMGYFRWGSRELVEYLECPLLPKDVAPLLNLLLQLLCQKDPDGTLPLKHVVLKRARTGEKMLILIAEDIKKPSPESFQKMVKALAEQLMKEHPRLVSVYVNENSSFQGSVLSNLFPIKMGEEWLIETMPDASGNLAKNIDLLLSPLSFVQVNPGAMDLLYQEILKAAALTGEETLVDLYCGVGSIGLYLSSKCKQVVGIEEVKDAVKDAEANARRNNIENATFIWGPVEKSLPKWVEEGNLAQVVILDPPRKGCVRKAFDALDVLKPERIVYVSCNPASLARDLVILRECGYQVDSVVPVDMFPQTGHVESIVLMTNSGLKGK